MSERLIKTLAALATRKPLDRMRELCEQQSQVSAVRLSEYLDHAGDQIAGYALDLRHEFDALVTENERLRDEMGELWRQLDRFRSQSHGIPALSEIERLRARVAELERDAARYRWLRDRGFQYADADLGTDFHGDNFVSFRMRFNLPEPPHSNYEFEEWDAPEIDASIDAAMQQEPSQ